MLPDTTSKTLYSSPACGLMWELHVRHDSTAPKAVGVCTLRNDTQSQCWLTTYGLDASSESVEPF